MSGNEGLQGEIGGCPYFLHTIIHNSWPDPFFSDSSMAAFSKSVTMLPGFARTLRIWYFTSIFLFIFEIDRLGEDAVGRVIGIAGVSGAVNGHINHPESGLFVLSGKVILIVIRG